jgi:hypothetical protein
LCCCPQSVSENPSIPCSPSLYINFKFSCSFKYLSTLLQPPNATFLDFPWIVIKVKSRMQYQVAFPWLPTLAIQLLLYKVCHAFCSFLFVLADADSFWAVYVDS